MLTSLFNRIYRAFFGTSSSIHNESTFNLVPPIIHRVYEDEFIKNFDEIVIIGDIHGCFDEFKLLLDQINENANNQKRILKVCTGDLVNKGPKSKEVIEYFMENEDNCLSVRGNHDQVIMEQYVKFIKTGEIREENLWLKELQNSHFDYLKKLPYTIHIPKLNLIVVHAGLMPSVPLDDQELSNMIRMRNIIKNENNSQCMATQKDDEGVAWASLWNGPWHVYFGHDAKRKLQKYELATGLDTGVVYGKELTAKFVMGPRNGQFLTIKALKAWKPV